MSAKAGCSRRYDLLRNAEGDGQSDGNVIQTLAVCDALTLSTMI